MALKKSTKTGVHVPKCKPNIPFPEFGKTRKSCAMVGPRLRRSPCNRVSLRRRGRRKRKPQIPPTQFADKATQEREKAPV